MSFMSFNNNNYKKKKKKKEKNQIKNFNINIYF